MDTTSPNLGSLFEQLGLPSNAEAIQHFIRQRRPLDPTIPLPQAPWWTPAQAQFLEEALEEDSDWAGQVDELNILLRSTPS